MQNWEGDWGIKWGEQARLRRHSVFVRYDSKVSGRHEFPIFFYRICLQINEVLEQN